MTWAKICGLTRPEDVEAALAAGADALGFVMEPTSPRFVGFGTTLHHLAPEGIDAVAVFGAYRGEANLDGFRWAQCITGEPPIPAIRTLRLGEGWTMPPGDGPILIDAFDPDSFGGMGRRVDWEAAAEIVQATNRRVILAGGLTPENVAQAIAVVRPYGVDVSSGVEASPGVKDAGKVREFIAAVRACR
jgi:phosphoribosylanthranilate isomerase